MNLNRHTSRPSVFISSTFIDLKQERQEVARALKNRGVEPNALDVQSASSQTPRKKILDGIKESDFIILIIGDRYGSIIPEMTGSSSISITHWEYIEALKRGKPIIAFLKDIKIEEANTCQIKKFRYIVSAAHTPRATE